MDDDRNGRRIRQESATPDMLRTQRQPTSLEGAAASRTAVDELRRRLEVSQELAGIGDWVYDAASGAVTWSREVFRLLKRDPLSGQMTFDEFLFYYDTADSERLLEAMETVIIENACLEVEIRARLLNDGLVQHHCTLVPLSDQAGVVTGVNGFLRDAGGRNHAATVENWTPTHPVGVDTGDVVFRLLVPDGVCEYISPAIMEVSGRPPRDWYRIPFLVREMVHPDWLGRFDRRFKAFLAGNAPEKHVIPLLHPSGEVRWIRIRAVALGGGEDGICAIEGIAADITARVREELKRKLIIRQLRKAAAGKRILSGLVPICSFCKKVRDDQGLWTQIESYLTENCDLYFTHGLCPECLETHYPDYRQCRRR